MSRRSDDDLTVTAQIRISRKAKRLIGRRAADSELTPSAYVRRLLYYELGLIQWHGIRAFSSRRRS